MRQPWGCVSRVDREKRRRSSEKRVDDALVLLRLARTGGVHHAASRSDSLGRVLQHDELGGGQARQLALVAPPADVRIASQRPEAGTGSVDQDEIEWSGEGQWLQQICLNQPDAVRASARDRFSKK